MYPTQSNTRKGTIPVTAAAALTGKEGLLVKLTNASGKLNCNVLTGASDHASHVLVSGAASGGEAYLQPIVPGQGVRIRLNGTCVPGDLIVRADETGADAGKVTKFPGTTGTYTVVGLAGESGADEQLLEVLPYRLGDQITVA